MLPTRLTIPDIHAAYGAGTTPQQVVTQVYQRITAVGDPAIFILLRDQEDVLADAAALGAFDPALPLWGIPFVVKDNIDVAGLVTTVACPAFAYTAERDAFVVARLRAAGALLIGKTNLDQFATGLVGVRSPFGAPRNSIDPLIVPGGSSSGSAVAVGHGIVPFSLGTDTAGSGRVPAGLNNIVGLKPTLGAISARGVVPACRTIDTVSIFALTVADAWAAYRVCCAFDAEDAFARSVPTPPLSARAEPPVIGIPSAETIEFMGDDAQSVSFYATVDVLRATGAIVTEIDFTPLFAVARMLYDGAFVAERHTVIEDLLARDPDAILPVTRAIIGKALALSAADAFRGLYRLKELARDAKPALASVDMLCVPTIPRFHSLADLEADPVTPNSNFGTYTNFVNLLDMCGIAVPVAARPDGRPGSVTLLAPAAEDAGIAAFACLLEGAAQRTLGATGWPVVPTAPLPPAGPKTLTLAVCGAHMEGLPLHHQLTDRGASFARTARTNDAYRLFALAGGPPARPGLVRGAPGSGAPIAVELWDLPLHQIGGFLAGIPAPLCLGSIDLEDGTRVQGFLCEAAATASAKDITHLGGWRSFLSLVQP